MVLQNLQEVFFAFWKKHDSDLGDCRGQSYDNASNKSGNYTGLQA